MAKKLIRKMLRLGGVDVGHYNRALSDYRKLYLKYASFTMVPEYLFVANLELSKSFLHVEGDLVECGVWKGGMSAAMAEIAGPSRQLHLFDSFQGLPPAKEIDGTEAIEWQKASHAAGYFDNCSAPESFAIEAMRIAGHTKFQLHKGWFNETLRSFESTPISILRLDGDWYESIKFCLVKLFPLVSSGGLVIIDDYYTWDGCSKAVHDYLAETKCNSRVRQWNNQVAYIIKKN